MIITADHYRWWMQKQTHPALFNTFKKDRVSIHTLINIQTKQPRPNCTVLNTYVLIRSRLRRGWSLNEVLLEFYYHPNCSEPKIRKAVAGRLLKRLHKYMEYKNGIQNSRL